MDERRKGDRALRSPVVVEDVAVPDLGQSCPFRPRRRAPSPPRRAPSVDPSFFDSLGQWIQPVVAWDEDVDDRLVADSIAPALRTALDRLPSRQREVVLLRDVEGLSSEEASEVLGIRSGNQRVLLHRGRAGLREMLDGEDGEGMKYADVAPKGPRLPRGDRAPHRVSRRDAVTAPAPPIEDPPRRVPQLLCLSRADPRSRSVFSGSIEPEDLSPRALDELTELYRRWRAGE